MSSIAFSPSRPLDERARRTGRTLAALPLLLAVALAAPVRAQPPPAEALAAIERAIAANPYDGRLQQQLGFALRPLGRLDESARAFERAAELGWSPPANTYNAACLHAVAGRPEVALDRLERALELRFADDALVLADTDLESLRALPRFAEVTGLVAPHGLSREDGWRHDLEVLVRRMERMHWDLYAKVSKEDFAADVDAIARDVERLSDGQVRARLRRLLARVGDGHTHLAAQREGERTVPRFPLDLHLYTDGLHVRGAPRELGRLAGARVLALGPLPAERALEALRAYVSVDNEVGYRDWAGPALADPEILEAIGALAEGEPLALRLRAADGAERVETVAARLEVPHHAGRPSREGWVYANARAEAPAPLWLRHPEKRLWSEHLPEHDLVYAWIGEVADPPGGTFAGLCEELFAEIDRRGASRLVIDLRLNSGGNTGLVLPLIHGLVRCPAVDRDGGLYVVIGRRTFSAAMNLASLLELHTHATFVGEPTGSSPNFVGESTSFVLPVTKNRIYCSSCYWQHASSTDLRPWIAPAIVAEPSSADFAANRDPALEAILARPR